MSPHNNTMAGCPDRERVERVAAHIEAILRELGEDTSRQGLLKTPQRAAKALLYLTSGYAQDARGVLEQAMFDKEGDGMVTVADIEFYSMCEHHILPFFGTVSIGYVPGEKIVGLSKIARMVNVFARRLQVQERFTRQLADTLREALGAKGVIVRCQGEHLCMKMRGVEKQHAATVTVEYNGVFADDPALRSQFLTSLPPRI